MCVSGGSIERVDSLISSTAENLVGQMARAISGFTQVVYILSSIIFIYMFKPFIDN